jgi:hypothetical protein
MICKNLWSKCINLNLFFLLKYDDFGPFSQNKKSLNKLKTYNLYILILKWWKEEESIFPTIEFLAKQFEAILGSHTENERIFNLVQKFRVIWGHCRLSLINLDSLGMLDQIILPSWRKIL